MRPTSLALCICGRWLPHEPKANDNHRCACGREWHWLVDYWYEVSHHD